MSLTVYGSLLTTALASCVGSEGLIDWGVRGLRDLGFGEGLGYGGGDWGILVERGEEWTEDTKI